MVPLRRSKKKRKKDLHQTMHVKYIDFSNMGSALLIKFLLKSNGQSLKDNFRLVFPKNVYKNYPKCTPTKDRTE